MCCIFKFFPCSLLCSPAEPPSPSPSSQTAAQKKSRKSLNCSSDYWPRCGACSSLPHAATVATVTSLHAISRQNSSPAAIAPQHVSTVNVNVNVIKLDMSEAAPIAAPAPAANAPAPAPTQPSASQWTLLCSGSGVDRRQQPTVAVIRPRVIPLAANSLLLLGDCDLQETNVR